MLGVHLHAADYEWETLRVRALSGLWGPARYFAQLGRELRAYPGTLPLDESLELLRRKLGSMGAEGVSAGDVLAHVAARLRSDPPDDLASHPGIRAEAAPIGARLRGLERFFRPRAEELRRVLEPVDLGEGSRCVMLGGDAEKLLLAWDLTHGRPASFFFLSRQKLMSSPAEQAVLQENAEAVVPGGYTTRVNGPAPAFTRPRVWADNSLVASTVFQLVAAAQDVSARTGEAFEDAFLRLAVRELREGTLQAARRCQPVLFGTPHEAVAGALRKAMDGGAFRRRTLEVFEEFYREHLKDIRDVGIVELGSIGSQPLLLLAALDYLKSLDEADPAFAALSDSRREMARDLARNDKGIRRIVVVGFSARRAWEGVTLGGVVVPRPPSIPLTHLVEPFRTFDLSHDWESGQTVAVPRGPLEEAASYWVSLLLRNAMVERPAMPGPAVAAGPQFLGPGTSIWDEGFTEVESARARTTPTVAVDFDQTMADWDVFEDRFVLRPGFPRLLAALRERGYRLVLVTGTYRLRLRLFLHQHPEVARALDLAITQEDLAAADESVVRRAYPGAHAAAVARFLARKPGLRKDVLRLGHRAILEDEPLVRETLSELYPAALVETRVLLLPPFYASDFRGANEDDTAEELAREVLSRLDGLAD